MRMARRCLCALCALMLLLSCARAEGSEVAVLCPHEPDDENLIRVDFATHTGVPLLKRQNVFSPSHSFVGSYMAETLRDVPTLAALGAESQRVDLFMGNGGVGATIGRGTPEKLSSTWMQLDMTLRSFYKGGTLPYVVYFATPEALFDRTRGASAYWRYPPTDDAAWSEVCRSIAARYAGKGWPFAAHEVWNEPDWGDAFYAGTWEEYLKIYEAAVKGIREGDPHAMVGGLSLAEFDDYAANGNVEQFLSYVEQQGLPLDFISYHCYVPVNYPRYTALANEALAAHGDTFSATGLHLNEFHVAIDDDVTGTERCVGPMLDAILYTLEHPQITSVNWACFRVAGEGGIQMINSRNGKRLAAYHLLACYNRMPVDRVLMTEHRALRGLAAIEGDRAGVLLYNRTYRARDYTLLLEQLPWDSCDITVYCIDAAHSNYGRNGGSDELEAVLRAENVSTADLCLQGTLDTNAMLYAEIVRSGTSAELAPVTSIDGQERVRHADTATVLRREYYFEDRASTMFSEFDLRSFTAWAGMGNAETGLSKGAAVLDNVPEHLVARPSLSRPMAEGASAWLTAEYWADDTLLSRQHWQWDACPMDEALTLVTPADFDGVLRLSWGIRDAGADRTLKITIDKE